MRSAKNPKKPNEFRFAAFAWKKLGGGPAMLRFLENSGNGYLYIAGPLGNGNEKLTIRKTPPTEWSFEIRDVFDDHGGFAMTGFQVWPHTGDSLIVDALYFSKSKASLERLQQRK